MRLLSLFDSRVAGFGTRSSSNFYQAKLKQTMKVAIEGNMDIVPWIRLLVVGSQDKVFTLHLAAYNDLIS
jgi:hypothetical protein